MKASDSRYFEKLTSISSTLTSKVRLFGGFPVGLGPYQVASQTPDRLVLQANPGRVKGSFRAIEFRKFRDVTQDFAQGVFDFNHTTQVSIPDAIQRGFQRISRPFFKSYALVVNHPESAERKRFARCFPRSQLRALLGLPLKETSGFLPQGIQGSDWGGTFGEISQEWAKGSTCNRGQVAAMTFFNYRPELRSTLQAFLKSRDGSFPIPLRYEEGTVNELVRRVFREDRFSAVIGFDSSTSNSSAFTEAATFFESFIRSNRAERLITRPVRGLSDLVKAAAPATDSSLKAELYRKAHRLY